MWINVDYSILYHHESWDCFVKKWNDFTEIEIHSNKISIATFKGAQVMTRSNISSDEGFDLGVMQPAINVNPGAVDQWRGAKL